MARRGLFASRPLLGWSLVGAGAALVVVILIVILVK
jgi:hypothetical protein